MKTSEENTDVPLVEVLSDRFDEKRYETQAAADEEGRISIEQR